MSGRYIAFDVETPNYADNRMSIGSDSRARGEILLRYLRSSAEIEHFVRSYDMMVISTAGSHSRYSYER